MAALGEFVIRRRRVLGWGFGAVTVALVASVPFNELKDVFLHHFDESIEFRRDADFTVENLIGLCTTELRCGMGVSSEPISFILPP
ncbi:MAG: hypothetical protein OXH76_06255 [Boseongicola sp.]|nr:hypothetical protein [Boseongicola sp.]